MRVDDGRGGSGENPSGDEPTSNVVHRVCCTTASASSRRDGLANEARSGARGVTLRIARERFACCGAAQRRFEACRDATRARKRLDNGERGEKHGARIGGTSAPADDAE